MLNCSEDRAMSPEYLQAFNGGVNLVWNADFTFAWKLREVVQFDSINGGYRLLQAHRWSGGLWCS